MKRLLLVPVLAAGLLGLLAAPALASPQTFYVHPSGGNDTHNIQKAFNAAVKAGPGSTVQLTAGHFYINNIVVRNFDGTFKGAGEHKTVIDCLRGLDPSLPGVAVLPDAGSWPSLLVFKSGDIRASDMTFDITAASPAETWQVWFNGGTPGDYLGDIVTVTGDVVSSAFDHVAFITGTGSDSGYNADETLAICGTGPANTSGQPTTLWHSSGSESVCDCCFRAYNGVEITGLTNGRAMIADNVIEGYENGCLLFDNSNSSVALCHNQMSTGAGENFVAWQGFQASFGAGASLPPLPAPHYLIADNHMLATGSASAFFAEDDSLLYGADNRLHATIAGNTIRLDTTGFGIGEFATRGFWVFDNRISGSALTGMYLGDDYDGPDGTTLYPVSGWKIIGNDLHSLTTSMASIVLGNGSSHCLVVGGPPPTTVLNNGTDNTLINVTPVTDPPAAAATPMNALKQLKQLKGMMRP